MRFFSCLAICSCQNGGTCVAPGVCKCPSGVVKSVGTLGELYQFKSRIFTNNVFFFKGNPLMTTFYSSIINKK